jgi:very-short-patch-repair endonuclease
MTKEERHLWYDFLRSYPVKFYRQRRIETYIVDFYSNESRLVIEIDGGQHYETDQQLYDLERTKRLEMYGLTVLRFTNTDIQQHFTSVCQSIDIWIKKQSSLNQD